MRCSGDGYTYEVKDPAIKLFGTIIRLPESDAPANLHRISDAVFPEPQISDPPFQDQCSGITAIEAKDIYVQDCGNKEKASTSGDKKREQTLNNKEETQLGTNLQEDKRLMREEEKVLKKPDKIIPCPRCTSLETKFCYFNNYNVKQPRHFCRNCQRYWTAGGTMRKVAVGAGRRKNKQLATEYCQIPAPHVAVQSATDPNIVAQELVPGESLITLMTSAQDEKLCKIGSEKITYESVHSLYPSDRSRLADIGSIAEIKEEPSQCVSSMTSIHEDETHEQLMGDEQGSLTVSYKGLMPQQALPCFPSSPWMSAWNPCWNSTTPLTVMSHLSSEPTHQSDDVKNHINWLPSPMMAVCRLGAPTIPMQFTPTPYWGLSYWPVNNNTGNTPLPESSSGSQTTSKHSRDEGFIEAKASKKRVIVPMTL